MRISIATVLLLLTSSAEAEPQALVGLNGRPAYILTCGESQADIDDCHRRAVELCPNGVLVLSRESAAKVVSAIAGTTAVPQDSFVIECK